MTVTLDRPSTTHTSSAPPLAQVNLLPPEIRARRAVQRLSRWLVGGLSALTLALVAGYVAADRQVDAADAVLEAAQARTATLTQQQLAYADVPTVLNRVALLQEARAQGFSTEVSWAPVLRSVLAVLPDGAELHSATLTAATPMVAAAPAVDPLQAASLARLTLTASTTTLPATADWVSALNATPGLSDAWVSAVTLTADEDGALHYDVSASVQVTDQALTHRFDVQEDS
ncbi:fimbrial assembly protein [uncultured Cellulomonas sp.]|uniref:fimbrial assembly protein n=1 Tax=uncultured Cellulomonas sp. TaxID=189682 RepID=UPI00262A5722|nr:fimbrial assembly protein [uncultured Cellulomonas sp.]